MSSFRSGVLDRKYIFEYDVGLWTFGTIQVLKDRKTGELRTCKTVQKSMIRNPADAMARLHRLRELQHERLCGISDVLEDQSRIYVFSDKCAGGDVAEWIVRVQEEGNWLQEQTVADYVRQALIAVAHAHGNRTSHRDLRPSSLALTSKLPDAQVKVCDFGLAEVLDPQDEVLQRSPSPYSAPEVRGRQGAGLRVMPGAAADMWAIGAIAHQLLVGAPPPSQEDGSGGWAALAWASTGALSRSHFEMDTWAERSALSGDFVRRLLKQQASDRPTAAVALQHPWMQACVPLDPARWVPGSEVAAELQNRLLCYVLGVLLLPELMQYKDLFQLRSAFAQADGDRDGFVSRATANRLLRERGASPADAAAALDATDVTGTGVVDLAALAAAAVVAQVFSPGEGPEEKLKQRRAAAALVSKLTAGFFRSYGDVQRLVAGAGMAGKLSNALVREMEVHAGLHYNEIIAGLPDEGTFDAQALRDVILEGQGRGTPLAAVEAVEEHDVCDVGWGGVLGMEGLHDLMKGVFQTCGMGSEKQRGYRRIVGGLGGN